MKNISKLSSITHLIYFCKTYTQLAHEFLYSKRIYSANKILQLFCSRQIYYNNYYSKTYLLAHLSRRLVGELIVYPWSGVRPSSSSVVHNFKHEYLCNQWADHNQILSEASLGWGKGCIWFWARSDQNSGFHGNRKLP